MLTDELDYNLPPDLIATQAARPRDAAKLMVIDRAAGTVHHRRVSDLPALKTGSPGSPVIAGPAAGDLLVFNRSRVLPAYFKGRRVNTGGVVTGLYVGSEAERWEVMLEARGRLTAGERIALDDQAELELIEPLEGGAWKTELCAAKDDGELDALRVLERVGQPPLPPYIRKARRQREEAEFSPADRERYNTVYAAEAGSIAAPTAGLHFTDELLAGLMSSGVNIAFVTLHVGIGTFAPVRAAVLEEHDIHEEWLTVPANTIEAINQTRARGGRVIPVGTTTVRALESLPEVLPDPGTDFSTSTRLFITPGEGEHAGFTFRYTDALMTNFHLPRSTLLAMVAALPGVGLDQLKHWYRVAIEHRYRFYSYGDAMLIV